MQVTNRAVLQNQARAQAYRDARSKAQQLAHAAGAALGPAVNIDATASYPNPLPIGLVAESAVADVPV